MPAPIVLFVYNRPQHTKITVHSLLDSPLAKQSDLFVFSDAERNTADADSVAEVRRFMHTVTGFKSVSITELSEHRGLAASVISGVSAVLNEYDSVVVLEDDLELSSCFLEYMNNALRLFATRSDIFSIGGYSYPPSVFPLNDSGYSEEIYLSPRFGSWGWATWRNRWELVDWSVADYRSFISDASRTKAFNRGGADRTHLLQAWFRKEIDSWAIRFDYAHFVYHAYSVRPLKTLVRNIGLDGSGTHCDGGTMADDTVSSVLPELDGNIVPNERVERLLASVHRRPLYKRVLDRIPWFRKFVAFIRHR